MHHGRQTGGETGVTRNVELGRHDRSPSRAMDKSRSPMARILLSFLYEASVPFGNFMEFCACCSARSLFQSYLRVRVRFT